MNKRIAITSGEPSGIGPELMYHLSKLEFEDIQFVVLGDRKLIEKRASLYGSDFTISEYDKNRFEPQSIGNICIMDIPLNVESVAGQPVMINGTIGALSENSITWVEGGVECFLVSETLDTEQLVSVAASVSNLAEK